MASIPEHNQPVNLKESLIDLASYRKVERMEDSRPDPLVIFVAYAQESHIYMDGEIVEVEAPVYRQFRDSQDPVIRNELVNKFGHAYAPGSPLLLHKKLADVIIDTAIDMRNRYQQFTVVMDGLRSFDSGLLMQENRPDLVASGMLAKAGTSAHNRALAVDSKLFHLSNDSIIDSAGHLRPLALMQGIADTIPLHLLAEADEHGHLDDEQDMAINSRFYNGPMSDAARANRLNRLQAWQRASVKNRLPVANLLAEFWDDRVPGSPADMWRIASCRALCIGVDGNPRTNPLIQELRNELNGLQEKHEKNLLKRQSFAERAQAAVTAAWDNIFTHARKNQLETLLGTGGGNPPALSDYIFHEWLESIHDRDLVAAGFPPQACNYR
jgi:hypothetical protein